MRGERGQATIEWIGLVLLIALALGALTRLAGRVEPAGLATALLKAPICAAKGGCPVPAAQAKPARVPGDPPPSAPPRSAPPRSAPPRSAPPTLLVTAPPLVPLGDRWARPRGRRAPAAGRAHLPRGAGRSGPLRRGPGGARLRRVAGGLWRKAWLICFGYERARYRVLHPESATFQTVPVKGLLQIVNDCASPVDFPRDWDEILRPR